MNILNFWPRYLGIMLLCLLAQPALSWTSFEPRVSNREYLVIAYDGTQHLLTLQYSADLRWRQWQTGRASKPANLRFRDDRQCHYEIVLGNSKRATSSINLATGTQDGMLNEIASSVEGPPSSSLGDLNQYGNRMLFGLFTNIVEESERLSDIMSTIKWDVDKPLDVLTGPVGTLVTVAEAGFSGFRVMGNSLGRAIGLRTGINCGEAQGIIAAQVNFTKDIHYKASELLEIVDYYFSVLQLRSEWAYFNFNTGQYVGAAWVIPKSLDKDYNKIFELEAQLLASEVAGERVKLSDQDREELNAIEVNADLHQSVLKAILPRTLSTLESNFAAKRGDFDQRAENIIALFPGNINERLNGIHISLNKELTKSKDEGNRALFRILGVNFDTSKTILPNCIVLAGEAKWVGTLHDDPIVEEKIISSWLALMADMSLIGNEALRIASFSKMLPEEQAKPFLNRSSAILDALKANRELLNAVEIFLDKKAACKTRYGNSDQMFQEVLIDGKWVTVRVPINRFDGVTDPLRDPYMRSVFERDVLSRNVLKLPDTFQNLGALNAKLGLKLSDRP